MNRVRLLKFASLIAIAALMIGCATTRQARGVEESGFLGDAYPLLRDGEKGEAIKVYKKEGLDMTKYPKVLVDPVAIEKIEELSEGGAENLQNLANNFYIYLTEEMKQEAELAKAPGPGTARIQVAIFDAGRRGPVRDLVSSVVPIGAALSLVKDAATGKAMAVGELSTEIKVTDAQTGELLAAAMDRRVGGKYSKVTIDTWSDADDAMQHWARQLRYRYCQLEGGQNCPEP